MIEQLSLLELCGDSGTATTTITKRKAKAAGKAEKVLDALRITTELARGSCERRSILPARQPGESVIAWLKRIRPLQETGPKPKKNVGEAFRASLRGKRRPRVPKGVQICDELALEDRSDWE